MRKIITRHLTGEGPLFLASCPETADRTRASFSALDLRQTGASYHAHIHTAGRLLVILQRAERRLLKGDEQPTSKRLVLDHTAEDGNVHVWRIEEVGKQCAD